MDVGYDSAVYILLGEGVHRLARNLDVATTNIIIIIRYLLKELLILSVNRVRRQKAIFFFIKFS